MTNNTTVQGSAGPPGEPGEKGSLGDPGVSVSSQNVERDL